MRALLERKAALAAAEPSRADHAARREWFRAWQQVTEELRPFVWKQEPEAEAELARVRAEVAANEVLRRRDYAWVLYPEETLRPFLQRFLKMCTPPDCVRVRSLCSSHSHSHFTLPPHYRPMAMLSSMALTISAIFSLVRFASFANFHGWPIIRIRW